MTSRATKKISTCQKSLIKARHPMQKPQKRTVKNQVSPGKQPVQRGSAGKNKGNLHKLRGLESMGPREIQFLAPKKIRGAQHHIENQQQVNTATGQRRDTVDFRSRSSRLSTRNTAMPAITQMVWVSRASGE